ncbi:hypothetical protein [Viscerimonas tarda]
MNKVAIIEVKVGLPANFKPKTLTYRAFSLMEKDSEKDYVIKCAEELFVEDVLKNGAGWKLEKSVLKVKSSVKLHNVHCYILTENEVRIKFEKDNEQA